jgi:class 3 adenylate cyclase/tetratricopeptide (TPR) repeat protein
MKCPKCQFENPEGKKFCGRCGTKMESICPSCQSANPPDFQFCGDCGHQLEAEPSLKAKPLPPTDSERKHVTVLFSDMSSYTAMTEKMDPEEVKEIMGKIFGEISKVVAKYGGFIEKFIGDAVMALFGVPTAHEDDPVRAIKASREIHDIVSSLSLQFEKRIGKALCMHTGICTGLVVTGEVNLEKGTHGVLGDTINTAARLSGLAKPGEIVISPDTYYQSEGYFNFEALAPTIVKGKAEPIRPYKILSAKEDPTKTHRLSGMRAELIGRKVEMAQLQEAVEKLKEGKGSIFSIVGDAGTGKSRLIAEFKASFNLDEVQWREGHAYAYSQNIPYFPLIDLLSRAWQIQEGDSPEQVRKKVETGAGFLIGDRSDLIPYLGSLYSLKYPEIENVSPEYWKAKLHEAVQMILSALTRRAPTVICIEDLHWADPSSVELLRNILSDFRYPAVFLCIYRPTFSLFTSHQAGTIKSYQEIRLQDLSPTDAQSMVESLLKTESAPAELKKFIRNRVEGNPFYLEEVINSLLETVILVSEDGQWKLTKPLIEANVPSTVQGVISARLDRLETETKRILQEASVIGRAFLYEILKRITELKDHIDRSLMGLERLDLIRTRSLQPDLEYIFKHALTQEVVYNGLLKKERQNIHEKIAQVMEELFKDRIPEFYEALAYHFKQGHSITKAVDYLMKAGEKSFNRYALDEAHQYYKGAFGLLSDKTDKSIEHKSLLVDVLLQWSQVFYRRSFFTELSMLLEDYEDLAISLDDKARLGMYYVRQGGALLYRQKLREAHQYLQKALGIAEEIKDQRIIGYSYGFLTWCCAELGMLDEAVEFGKIIHELNLQNTSDQDLFRYPSWALGYMYWERGEVRKTKEIGNAIIEYAQKHSNMACMSDGNLMMAFGHSLAGDFISAIEYAQKAVHFALEPMLLVGAKTILGMSFVANRQYVEAENVFTEAEKFLEDSGYEYVNEPNRLFSGMVMVTKGNLSQGINMMEEVTQKLLRNESRWRYAFSNYVLGQVYLQMVQGAGEKSFSFIARNIGFLIKTVPFAYKKAGDHLMIAIQTAREIGAKGVLAQAYFDMGRLRQTKGKTDEARKYIADAIQLFEECEADVFLKQAREALAALR